MKGGSTSQEVWKKEQEHGPVGRIDIFGYLMSTIIEETFFDNWNFLQAVPSQYDTFYSTKHLDYGWD